MLDKRNYIASLELLSDGLLPVLGAASIDSREAPTRQERRRAKRDLEFLLRLDRYIDRVKESARD